MGSSDKSTEILAVLEHISDLAYQHDLILRSIDKALYGIHKRIDFLVTHEGSPIQQAHAAAKAKAPGTSTHPPSSNAPTVSQSTTPASAESPLVPAEPKVDSAKDDDTERKKEEVVKAPEGDADEDEADEDPKEASENEDTIGDSGNLEELSHEDTSAHGGGDSDDDDEN